MPQQESKAALRSDRGDIALGNGASRDRAAQRLGAGEALNWRGRVALSLDCGELICDVLDGEASLRRCEYEFEVVVENARRALESAGLVSLLPSLPRRWRVVDALDPERAVRWPPG
jgi:hypothetical protein